MSPLTRLIIDSVLQTALIFLFIASLASVLFGAALLLRQHWALRFSDAMNRWISTRQLMRPLDVQRDVQRHLYRRHPWVGAFIILGALYVIYFLFFGFDKKPFLLVLGRDFSVKALDWLLDSLWWIVLVTNLFAVVIGLIMFFRPSLLKGMEVWADRIYSTREMGKFWETMNLKPDQVVRSYPRFFGWAIVLGGLYATATLSVIVLGQISR